MAASGVLGRLKVILAADATQMQKGFDKAEGKTKAFGARIRRVSDEMNRVFVRGMVAGTAALTGFAAASVKVGSEFEHAMQFVGATANATGDEMVALEAEARNIGSTTLFSARQAAQGMTEFARAGMTTNEIISASRPAMLLAGATMTDMATATQGMSATLRQFGLDTSEASRVSDVLALATRKSLFNLSGLLTAMKYGGPQARAYGLSLEEAVAAMMEFRNIGLEAHQAGVYFRMMLAKTGKVTPEAESELRKYGLTTDSISLKTNNFAGVLKNLADADIPKAAGAMERIFGVRAGPVVQVLVENMKLGKDEFNAYTDALLGAGGTTEDMYNRLLDTVTAQFTIMKSAFEELMIVIFQTYGGALKSFFTELAETFQYTASYLSSQAAVGNGLSDVLKNMTNWLRENRVTFAVFIGNMISLAGTLAGWLVTLIRWSRVLMTILAAVWVASKVHAYVSAIMAVWTAVKALTVGVYGLRAGIIAVQAAAAFASGGIIPIVAAITSGIVALGLAFWGLGGSIGGSADHLERFLELHEKSKAAIEEGYNKSAVQSKNYAAALKHELDAAGLLDQTTEGHIRHLEQMTKGQMVTNVEGGKWVEVMQDGEKVMLSQAVIWDLYNKGTDKGIELHGLLKQKITDQNNSVIQLNQTNEVMKQKASEYLEIIRKTSASWTVGRDLREKFHQRFNVHLDEALGKTKANNKKIAEDEARLKNMVRNFQDERRRIQSADLKATLKAGEEEADQRAKNTAKFLKQQKEKKKALEALLAYEAKISKDIDNLLNNNLNAKKYALAEELKAYKKVADEHLKFFKKGSIRRQEWEYRFKKGHDDIIFRASLQSQQEFQNIKTRLHQSTLEDMAITSEEKLELAEKKERDSAKKLWNEEKSQFAENSLERQQANIDYLETLFAIKKYFLDQEQVRTKTRHVAFLAEMEKEEEDHQKSLMTKSERLQFESTKRAIKLNSKTTSDADNKLLKASLRRKKRSLAKEMFASLKNIETVGRKSVRLELLAEKKGMGIFKKFLKEKAALKAREFKLDEKRHEYENIKWSLSNRERLMAEAEMANEAASIQKEKMRKILKIFKDVAKAIVAITKGLIEIGKKGAETFKFFSDFNFDLRGIVGEFADAASEMASKGAQMDVKGEANKKVTELVDKSVGFMRMAVEAVPALLEELTNQLPRLFQAFVESVPQIINGFADNIGALVSVIVEAIPGMVTAILSALPNLVTVIAGAISTIISALPAIIDAIIAELPAILQAVINGLVGIIYTLADTLPIIIEQIVSLIPIVLDAVIAAIPVLIPAIIRLILRVFTSLVQAIPVIIESILDALPMLIEAIVGMIPVIIQEIVAMLPALISSIVSLLPMLFIAVIKAIPMIIASLVKSLFTELLPAIPKIVIMIVKSALMAIVEGMKKVGQAVGDLFRSKKGKKEAKGRRSQREADAEQGIRDEFANDTGLASFYSGVKYIPSNMRVNVHQGEAIIPADRNAANSRGGTQQAYAGGGGAGSMNQAAPIDIAIMAEGRLLDAVQITAMRRGNAPGISKQLTRASGVTVGLDRGRFNYWTKKS